MDLRLLLSWKRETVFVSTSALHPPLPPNVVGRIGTVKLLKKKIKFIYICNISNIGNIIINTSILNYLFAVLIFIKFNFIKKFIDI